MQISGRRIGFDELPENEAGSLQDVLPRRGYRDHTKIELRVEGRWLWVRRVWIGWIEDFTGLRTSNGTVWDINDVADEPFPRSW